MAANHCFIGVIGGGVGWVWDPGLGGGMQAVCGHRSERPSWLVMTKAVVQEGDGLTYGFVLSH